MDARRRRSGHGARRGRASRPRRNDRPTIRSHTATRGARRATPNVHNPPRSAAATREAVIAISQNGWEANRRDLVSSRSIPGTSVRVTVRNGPAGDLLLAVARLYAELVETIDVGPLDDWGYAERPIRGTTDVLSNHASGTAIDLNATRHPLGTPPEATFSAQQISTIRAIVDRTNRVVRWGGDYGVPARGGVLGSRPDPMHFEISDHQTETSCAAALAVLTGGDTDVELSDRLPDLYTPDTKDTMTVGDTLAWACAHAARARDAAERVEKKVDALIAKLGELG